MDILLETLKWSASISGMIAAFMVSLDSGRRVTGWGFVLFVGSSILWIISSMLDKEAPLGVQNAVLLAINLFGVYRYLIRKKAPT